MRLLMLLAASMLVLFACNKKSVPSKTTNATIVKPGTKNSSAEDNTINSNNTNSDSVVSAPVTPAVPAAMIIIDGYGKILTPASKLPAGANLKPDYSTIARSFTPQQIANLKARYKTIPPKVLYVPEQYTLKSLKGTYCIYKKKFWYWKKDDGLFYIDQMYYQ
ncbi:MAG: hypothetical protein ABI921_14580 [Panacibacter sp.]